MMRNNNIRLLSVETTPTLIKETQNFRNSETQKNFEILSFYFLKKINTYSFKNKIKKEKKRNKNCLNLETQKSGL